MASPTPRYIITWPGYWTRSPAIADAWSRGAAARIWAPLWLARSTPARTPGVRRQPGAVEADGGIGRGVAVGLAELGQRGHHRLLVRHVGARPRVADGERVEAHLRRHGVGGRDRGQRRRRRSHRACPSSRTCRGPRAPRRRRRRPPASGGRRRCRRRRVRRPSRWRRRRRRGRSGRDAGVRMWGRGGIGRSMQRDGGSRRWAERATTPGKVRAGTLSSWNRNIQPVVHLFVRRRHTPSSGRALGEWRRGRRCDRLSGVVAVVLAAGAGTRFRGPGHKLDAVVADGRSVLDRAVGAALAAGIGPVVVVTAGQLATALAPGGRARRQRALGRRADHVAARRDRRRRGARGRRRRRRSRRPAVRHGRRVAGGRRRRRADRRRHLRRPARPPGPAAPRHVGPAAPPRRRGRPLAARASTRSRH